MEIKQLKSGEIPEGVEEFWLIRKDCSGNLILEYYQKNSINDWYNTEIHEFCNWTSYNKEEVLEEAKFILLGISTLYVEEETFWDDIEED